ncbi:MAG TPA: ABC transporter permease [Puia sp.]|nr:ABC transporter permease [Puia sp.]
MLRSYFKIAWRHLARNRGYSFINIAGLGIGLAITLLIGLWIVDEFSFDHYHVNHRRIAEVMLVQRLTSPVMGTQASPEHPVTGVGQSISTVIGPILSKDYKYVFQKTALISYTGDHLIGFGDKALSRRGNWTQYIFPEIFGFHMLAGSTAALKDPSTLLLAESTARDLFGHADPMGKTVRLDNKQDYRVGGVFADLPFNTTFHETQFLLPWDDETNRYLNSNTNWDDHSAWMFGELADGVTFEQATARIRGVPTPHLSGWVEELMAYPLDRLHLHDQFDQDNNGIAAGGRIRFVWLFGTIGAFILLLACINFMNLSTARSEQRAREVGIRKTVGSLRGQLIGQFLGESILTVAVAFVLALSLAYLGLPAFNGLAEKEITIPLLSPVFWLAALGFILITGILAGSYPAFYLSGFRAVKVLKGTFRAGRGATLPRRILVVTQFTVSLSLTIATIVIFRQIQLGKDRPVGYDRAGLINVQVNTDTLYNHYDALRQELLNTGTVSDVALASYTTTGFWDNNELEWPGETQVQKGMEYRNVSVSPEFGKTVGWTVVRGRDFSRDFSTDSGGMILNQAAVKATGFKEPIGRQVKLFDKRYTIIGVVKDMLTNSPYDPVEPAVFVENGYKRVITIRVRPGASMHNALARMEPIFSQYNPGSPFLYQFNDEGYAQKFDGEARMGSLSTIAAALAIFISCLGLFGLASFIAEQRTKELGVRKVLGARVLQLWALLSGDFVRLVILSMLIAMPLAYWAMHQWLQNYAIHTPLSWWVFAASGLGVLAVTLLTVSFQSIKAAMMNPVRSLRSE